VDAFAGAGMHLSRTTGDMVAGSPLNALQVRPPFREYHLIDLDGAKATVLREMVADRSDVHVYEGDCNFVLMRDVFPRLRYEDFRRGLVLLDPYGLHLDWQVIHTAGQLGTVDVFLNFPVADMNRNVLWRNPENVDAADVARMNRFWGDDTWRQVAYTTEGNLFGWEEKTDNETVAGAFRTRLRTISGFSHVPEPLPMRNTRNAVVYYLYFASQKDTANRIVTDIFSTYRSRQG
jgi:three-Cys-motif partner protein